MLHPERSIHVFSQYYHNLVNRLHLRQDLKHKDQRQIAMIEQDVGLPKGAFERELSKPFWRN